MTTRQFAWDSAQIAAQRLRRGEIDRRSFMLAIGALGLTGSLPMDALAAVSEIVVCCWGGTAVAAFSKAYGEPFNRTSGIKVVVDGSGPAVGAIRAMVESGHVTWDATDGGMADSLVLAKNDLVQPIDYSIVDRSRLPANLAGQFGVSNYVFADVLTYDAEKTRGIVPSGWSDFFDQKKFPGKRSLCKWVQGQLECVLLADGVAPANLYPLDVDRAFKKLKPMLDDIIFWDGGAQSQQLFREGEVVMGNLWHTRANLLNKESAGRFRWTWSQNILVASAWSVPKGNPAGKKVFEFINSTLDPAAQLVLFRAMGSAPSNPKTLELMTQADEAMNPTSKANAMSQVSLNPAYYAEHASDLQDKYLDFISR